MIKLKGVLVIFSILIWSIVIDLFCYFLYPELVGSQNVFQGIVFNSKYILSNTITIGIISIIDYIVKRNRNMKKCNTYKMKCIE